MPAAVKTMKQLDRPPQAHSAEGPPAVAPRLYRFRVDQYERMIAAGVLTSEDRVELIDGVVVRKMTQNPPHAAAIDYTVAALRPLLREDWLLREQKPIKLSDSEPEPDLVILRGPLRLYERRHPRPADLAVVVEVADTTLEFDRRDKGLAYARARIPVYWIINLIDRRVEVYTEPKGGKSPAYRRRTDYSPDAEVPLVIDGDEVGKIRVRELLPSDASTPSS